MKGLFHIVVSSSVKFFVIGVFYITFITFPDRSHRIKRLYLLALLPLVASFFFPRSRAQHFYRIPYVIRIFLDKFAYTPLGQIFAVFIVFVVLFQLKNNRTSALLSLRFVYGVAVATGTAPAIRLIVAVFFTYYRYRMRHHKRRIKSYAELAYKFVVRLVLVFKLKRSARRNGSEIIFQFGFVHSYSVIFYGKRACRFVDFYFYCKISVCGAVGKRNKPQLIYGVGRI